MRKSVPVLVAALTLAGCGEESKEQPKAESDRLARESEMVALRVRRMEGLDREPSSSTVGTNLGGERPMDKVGWESERAGDQVAKFLKGISRDRHLHSPHLPARSVSPNAKRNSNLRSGAPIGRSTKTCKLCNLL